jgi:hypothetical protein
MLTLTTEQKAKVTVKPLTAGGKPARVDGVPGWNTSDVAVATLVVAPDGMSADVFAAGVGFAEIVVAADADLTAGVRQITGSLSVTVVEAEALTLTLDAGVPTAV